MTNNIPPIIFINVEKWIVNMLINERFSGNFFVTIARRMFLSEIADSSIVDKIVDNNFKKTLDNYQY